MVLQKIDCPDIPLGTSGISYAPQIGTEDFTTLEACATTDAKGNFQNVPCSPPLDVPAKEWDGPDYAWNCAPAGMCTDVISPVHHISCEDKKRVLLSSEDGKHHCYAFYIGAGH
jgi:hypothetical protein